MKPKEITADYDCVIIGGGPAGLSAALVLGRCRRRVALIDNNDARNRKAHEAHGVFTRDCTQPQILRQLGREDLRRYQVDLIDDLAVDVRCGRDNGYFFSTTAAGLTVTGRKLLLATGMRDRVPAEPGFRERFGRRVFVCPYCDGWEWQDRKLIAYAPATTGPDYAMGLRTWSNNVILATPNEIVSQDEKVRLARNGIGLREQKIASLEGRNIDDLSLVHFADGESLPADAVFIHFGEEQASPFALALGCELAENGTVKTHKGERLGPYGIFIAGDASDDLQLIPIAIAEGAKAACAINTELRREDER